MPASSSAMRITFSVTADSWAIARNRIKAKLDTLYPAVRGELVSVTCIERRNKDANADAWEFEVTAQCSVDVP